jgi:hypothetical protein
MTWPLSWERKQELRAERFKDKGGTREEWLTVVQETVTELARERGLTDAQMITELSFYLKVANKIWDTPTLELLK